MLLLLFLVVLAFAIFGGVFIHPLLWLFLIVAFLVLGTLVRPTHRWW